MARLELRRAHKQNPADLAPKASANYPDPDFLPFVCHYDKDTILTKNGELMKVIRITGFNHESVASELVNLRETLRDAITNHIKSSNFALWIHTIRRKKSISVKGKYDDYFSAKLDEIWQKENDWENQFVNELYLTIIIEGLDTSVSNFNAALRSLSFSGTRNLHSKELAKSHQILNELTLKILDEVNDYGAKILGMFEWEGILYSQPMRFFGKIVNLSEDRYPITFNDMSEDLANHRIAFGNNSLEVIGEDKKNFATMFSVKEYREISVDSLDKLLQLQQEFIITQSVDFIDRNKALLAFDYQNYILDISGDEQLKYLSGLETIIESDSGETTDYGEQQITIMLINETTEGLQKNIATALEKLHSLGLVTVREDVFSEHCFWSQLPGNFKFLRRQKPINISGIAGFSSLHNFPAGNRKGNHWGDAVTVFRTVLGTPYFFNFHYGDNGHTTIVGPRGSGKTVMLNFLVSQSRKLKNKLFYFDHNHSGRVFIKAIGGEHFIVTNKPNEENLKINPLFLPAREENKAFLNVWFRYLVSYGKDKISEEELQLIPQIIDQIIASGTRKLNEAAAFFNNDSTKNIASKLAIWHSGGKFSFIFDHESESDFINKNPVNAFDLSILIKNKALLIPVITYLLYRIELSLDGSPTMIVLDEAWKLVDNYALGPGIKDWLIRLRKKNCMVIFATESVEEAGESSISDAIGQEVATSIFLPNPSPTDYYKTVFGLSDNEFKMVSTMSNEEHHFLFKHGEDAVVATLDLSATEEMIEILSADENITLVVNEIQNEVGKEPEKWLPAFHEVIKQLVEEGDFDNQNRDSEEAGEVVEQI